MKLYTSLRYVGFISDVKENEDFFEPAPGSPLYKEGIKWVWLPTVTTGLYDLYNTLARAEKKGREPELDSWEENQLQRFGGKESFMSFVLAWTNKVYAEKGQVEGDFKGRK